LMTTMMIVLCNSNEPLQPLCHRLGSCFRVSFLFTVGEWCVGWLRATCGRVVLFFGIVASFVRRKYGVIFNVKT
jgi:hypothetical protein